MAVQGDNKGSVFCEKCFMSNAKEAEYCVHCGASLSNSPFAQGSDTAIYPKLAEANLLRMRSKFKEAEDICLSILHQFPHNLSANILLGDIAVEKGDLDQATEWYELALDIDPDAQAVEEKLEDVRLKREEVITATTVEQLGLPTKKQRPIVLWISIIAGIVIVGGLGWIAYRQTIHSTVVTDDPNAPYIIPPNPPIPPNPKKSGVSEDEALTKAIQAESDLGAFVTTVEYDPALNGITITYATPKHKDQRLFAANLAAKAFPDAKEVLKSDVDQVQLRALDDDKLSYGAIVYRTDYDEAMKDDWQSAHKDDPLAFANAILKKEIFPNAPKTSGSDETSTTGGGTDDTTGGATAATTGTSNDNAGGATNPTAGAVSTTGSQASTAGSNDAHGSGASKSSTGNPPGAPPNNGASSGG